MSRKNRNCRPTASNAQHGNTPQGIRHQQPETQRLPYGQPQILPLSRHQTSRTPGLPAPARTAPDASIMLPPKQSITTTARAVIPLEDKYRRAFSVPPRAERYQTPAPLVPLPKTSASSDHNTTPLTTSTSPAVKSSAAKPSANQQNANSKIKRAGGGNKYKATLPPQAKANGKVAKKQFNARKARSREQERKKELRRQENLAKQQEMYNQQQKEIQRQKAELEELRRQRELEKQQQELRRQQEETRRQQEQIERDRAELQRQQEELRRRDQEPQNQAQVIATVVKQVLAQERAQSEHVVVKLMKELAELNAELAELKRIREVTRSPTPSPQEERAQARCETLMRRIAMHKAAVKAGESSVRHHGGGERGPRVHENGRRGAGPEEMRQGEPSATEQQLSQVAIRREAARREAERDPAYKEYLGQMVSIDAQITARNVLNERKEISGGPLVSSKRTSAGEVMGTEPRSVKKHRPEIRRNAISAVSAATLLQAGPTPAVPARALRARVDFSAPGPGLDPTPPFRQRVAPIRLQERELPPENNFVSVKRRRPTPYIQPPDFSLADKTQELLNYDHPTRTRIHGISNSITNRLPAAISSTPAASSPCAWYTARNRLEGTAMAEMAPHRLLSVSLDPPNSPNDAPQPSVPRPAQNNQGQGIVQNHLLPSSPPQHDSPIVPSKPEQSFSVEIPLRPSLERSEYQQFTHPSGTGAPEENNNTDSLSPEEAPLTSSRTQQQNAHSRPTSPESPPITRRIRRKRPQAEAPPPGDSSPPASSLPPADSPPIARRTRKRLAQTLAVPASDSPPIARRTRNAVRVNGYKDRASGSASESDNNIGSSSSSDSDCEAESVSEGSDPEDWERDSDIPRSSDSDYSLYRGSSVLKDSEDLRWQSQLQRETRASGGRAERRRNREARRNAQMGMQAVSPQSTRREEVANMHDERYADSEEEREIPDAEDERNCVKSERFTEAPEELHPKPQYHVIPFQCPPGYRLPPTPIPLPDVAVQDMPSATNLVGGKSASPKIVPDLHKTVRQSNEPLGIQDETAPTASFKTAGFDIGRFRALHRPRYSPPVGTPAKSTAPRISSPLSTVTTPNDPSVGSLAVTVERPPLSAASEGVRVNSPVALAPKGSPSAPSAGRLPVNPLQSPCSPLRVSRTRGIEPPGGSPLSASPGVPITDHVPETFNTPVDSRPVPLVPQPSSMHPQSPSPLAVPSWTPVGVASRPFGFDSCPPVELVSSPTVTRKKPGTASPYFSQITKKKAEEAKSKAKAERERIKAERAEQRRREKERAQQAPGPVRPWPDTRQPTFGLIQEEFAHNPFQLVIGTIFCNRIPHAHARPVLKEWISIWPTPIKVLEGDKEQQVDVITKLGLPPGKVVDLRHLAEDWLKQVPRSGVVTKPRGFVYPPNDTQPFAGMRMNHKGGVPTDSEWEITHLRGLSSYMLDSWRIFCRDNLLRVKDREWRWVVPKDKELRSYVRWKWAKEGAVWWEKGDDVRCQTLIDQEAEEERQRKEEEVRIKREREDVTPFVGNYPYRLESTPASEGQ